MTVTKIPLEIDIPPHRLYQYIRYFVKDSILLESGAGPEQKAEASMIGFEPKKIIKIDQMSAGGKDDYSILRAELNKHRTSDQSKYVGGLVGVFSCDAYRSIEKLPDNNPQDKRFPDVLFGLFLDGIYYDLIKDKVHYFHHSTVEDRSSFIIDLIKKLDNGTISQIEQKRSGNTFHFDRIEYETSKSDFLKNVALIKERILEGETFQTVYSQRISASYTGDPFEVYLHLRKINPSPYLFFIDLDGYQVFGSSPETLVSVNQNTVRTFPIAGTRRRGSLKERESLKQELLDDPKERAEHNMLVDLGRNDLGKICEFGSIHVPTYMQVQEFSHVTHLVSIVEGELREDKDIIDAFQAVFPAGTVSGAPKIRSMEIIDEVEKMRRGPYAGAAGYLSLNNNMDLAITIRSFYTANNRIYLQAGSGIVMDSIPEKEHEESLHKLQALLVALNRCKKEEIII